MSHTNIQVAESLYTLKQKLEDILFPKIEPYQEGFLQVSDLHSLWYAEYGNPNGVPVLFLHGGPGFGCNPDSMCYFDPTYYRIILIDQRGAGRSTPFAELVENNTQNLIEDLEILRNHLKISKWLVFGGSWGSALALLYGESHPERCTGFILRGIFLARKHDAENLWYMDDAFPVEWDIMQKFLPVEERGDIFTSYYKRLMDPNPDVSMQAAQAFMEYNAKGGVLMFNEKNVAKSMSERDRMFTANLIFCHYSKNNFFIDENQILRDIHKINHLPLTIVHGRYDIICRLKSGYELWQSWPGAQLIIVPDAGHTLAEPGIAKNLIIATEKMKSI